MTDEIQNAGMQKLQSVNLEMIKLFAEICRKHKLQYFALGGTLLGAVRHQGFIPWDDDVDMGMPRTDYEKFLKIAGTELTGRYRLRTIETDDEYRTYFCKIEDTSVTLVREFYAKNSVVKKNIYAWIDIMPIDGMPTEAHVFRKHHEKMLKARKMISFSLMDKCMGTGKTRSKKQMMIIKTGLKTGLYKAVDTIKAFRRFDNLCKKYSYESSALVGNTYGIYKEKEFVPKRVFGKGCMLPFEDTEICCPADYDTYLKHVYGNYMILPPEQERTGHEIEFGN
ncbi:LPS biosynthesis protein [uncultured Roseburia sp.]|uniref:LicD family protein n=1 Tax=Brotonthovivens ammoniilytica TaxID=2981725 RepID=A0ABT2TKD8_9FIRM|nr:LicD family protein [Brotonthovivens ammoniilytica]MCU6762682.1 LicD family protein [Brotonthovivens ammoniilytica]SCI84611.1 LPS biosynthesis protein [uncultured Roseburia sp.]